MTIGPLLSKTLLPARAELQPCPEALKPALIAASAIAAGTIFLDPFAIAIAIPDLRLALGLPFAGAQWLLILHPLLLAAGLILGIGLGQAYGRWRMLSLGLAVGGVAALIAGLAPGSEFVVAARALQGMAAAVALPATLALIAVNLPKAERARTVERWSLGAAATVAAGIVLTSLLVWLWSWRGAFLLEAVLAFGCLVLMRLRVPIDFPELIEPRLDLVGAVLFALAGALVAFALTISSAGVGVGVVVSFLVAGLVGFGLFALWETTMATVPMVATDVFASIRFLVATGLAVLAHLGLAGCLLLVPIAVIDGGAGSPLATAAVYLAFLAGLMGSNRLTEPTEDRIGPAAAVAAGYALAAGALLGLSAAVASGRVWLAAVPTALLLGIGIGVAVAILLRRALESTPVRHRAAAAAGQNVVFRLAGALSLALIGAVAGFAYRDVVVELAPSVASVFHGRDFAAPVNPLPELLSIRATAIRLTFARVGVLGACGLGLASVIALFALPQESGQSATGPQVRNGRSR
ncbi:MFS transporter [Amorphus sp. 3PC139-8]|uniref:MFS transporter n=1 Tax=Amorphus sp. 3PC139-8 TaxID=2735676 RepID=UPI00345DC6AC